ncbi:MAG: hypothetical protein HY698_03455 [Deltaproteobacteria bacterium]|nr:hypothetical protein [Deltaproteobacteria bacterium]
MLRKWISGTVVLACIAAAALWVSVGQRTSRASDGGTSSSGSMSNVDIQAPQVGTKGGEQKRPASIWKRMFGDKTITLASKERREDESQQDHRYRVLWISKFEAFLAEAKLSPDQRQKFFSILRDAQEHLKAAKADGIRQVIETYDPSKGRAEGPNSLIQAMDTLEVELAEELRSVLDDTQHRLMEIHLSGLVPTLLLADIFATD